MKAAEDFKDYSNKISSMIIMKPDIQLSEYLTKSLSIIEKFLENNPDYKQYIETSNWKELSITMNPKRFKNVYEANKYFDVHVGTGMVSFNHPYDFERGLFLTKKTFEDNLLN